MAAAAAAEVQALLRFLTQDAKIPLGEVIPKIGPLRRQGLGSQQALAKADAVSVKAIFVDEKVSKQVISAAKRTSNPKKRSASQALESDAKRSITNSSIRSQNGEVDLTLPLSTATAEELSHIQIETNRAPLVLAFAVVLLEFTHPEQPLSSRLSLAQAVVSVNSQSKAKAIGLTSEATAEEEGWTKGQPKLKVFNREIAVMRRQTGAAAEPDDSQETVAAQETSLHDAFWGLDIEALRKSNGPLAAGKLAGSQGPPIHTPEAARSYLLRSISLVKPDGNSDTITSPSKKRNVAEIAAAKERAVSMLLQSIRLVCESWKSTLSAEDLDKRAWSWYLSVRPEVAQGQSGWGQRGVIPLAEILKLRRST